MFIVFHSFSMFFPWPVNQKTIENTALEASSGRCRQGANHLSLPARKSAVRAAPQCCEHHETIDEKNVENSRPIQPIATYCYIWKFKMLNLQDIWENPEMQLNGSSGS